MTLSRRDFFQTTAAVAAAAAVVPALPNAAHAAAPLAKGQAPGFYRYNVGDIQITAINDGFAVRPLDGFIKNADLKDVQAAVGAAFLGTENVRIPFTTLVVNTGSKLALIDTGNGDSGAPTSGLWMTNFKAAGFSPEQVDTVVISHFHGDHINGLRLKNGDAVFPNAEIMVPAAEWAFWMDDSKMAAAPDGMKGAFNNVRRVFAPVAKDVKQYEAGRDVLPGVTALAAYGHTPGHTIFAISSGSGRLLVMSDTTNHPALFVRNPDWTAVFDMDGDMARATRRKTLDMAAVEKMQVAFYHAPFPATGFIAKSGAGFELAPVAWSAAL